MAKLLGARDFVSKFLVAAKSEDLRLGKALVPTGQVDMFAKGQRVEAAVVSSFAQGLISGSELLLEGDPVVTPYRLRRDLELLIAQNEDLQRFQQEAGQAAEFSKAVNRVSFTPELLLHITVMRCATRPLYDKAILGAWLATNLALSLDFDRADIDAVLRGGLMRDVGMLYAPSHLACPISTDPLSRAEYEGLEEHVELGRQVVSRGSGLWEKAAELVGNHHERVDGSGYPRKLKGLDLTPGARMVALCDIVAAIRLRANASFAVELSDVHFVTNMVRTGLDPVLYTRFFQLCRPMEVSEGVSKPNVSLLLETCEVISDLVQEVEDRMRPNSLPGVDMRALRKRASRTRAVVVQSGIADKELAWWLKQVVMGREEATHAQLKQIAMLQTEILRQLRRIEVEAGAGPDVLTFSDVANR